MSRCGRRGRASSTPETIRAATDRLLLALRATGPDAYRGDADRIGCFDAYCPACASPLLGVRRLRIEEQAGGRPRFWCSSGCSPRSILTALRVAELRYERTPGLTDWGLSPPSADLAFIDAELDRIDLARAA